LAFSRSIYHPRTPQSQSPATRLNYSVGVFGHGDQVTGDRRTFDVFNQQALLDGKSSKTGIGERLIMTRARRSGLRSCMAIISQHGTASRNQQRRSRGEYVCFVLNVMYLLPKDGPSGLY
jgi:hypothetical protein